MLLDDVGNDLQAFFKRLDGSRETVDFRFQSLTFSEQSFDVRLRVKSVCAKFFQNLGIGFLIERRRDTRLYIVFPPLLSLFYELLKLRVSLGHLEGNGDGVLCTRNKLRRVFVVLVREEGSDHDDIIHTKQVGVQSRLQSVIFGNVLSPIFGSFGGFHFKDGDRLLVLIEEQIVPHTPKDRLILEKVSISTVEVVLTVDVSWGNNVRHEVRFLHELSLFRLDSLTCGGIDGLLKRLLISPRDFAPYLKGGRPRIQTENGCESGCRQLLWSLRGYDLDFVSF